MAAAPVSGSGVDRGDRCALSDRGDRLVLGSGFCEMGRSRWGFSRAPLLAAPRPDVEDVGVRGAPGAAAALREEDNGVVDRVVAAMCAFLSASCLRCVSDPAPLSHGKTARLSVSQSRQHHPAILKASAPRDKRVATEATSRDHRM